MFFICHVALMLNNQSRYRNEYETVVGHVLKFFRGDFFNSAIYCLLVQLSLPSLLWVDLKLEIVRTVYSR